MTPEWQRNLELAKVVGPERVTEFSAFAGKLVNKLHPPPANPSQLDQGRSIGVWHQQICDEAYNQIMETFYEVYCA